MAKLSIGEFLSVLRKGQGFTQEEIADKLGVSAKTISSWENNRTYPDIMMLPIIADLYGITVDELVRGERITKEQTKNEVQISDKSVLKIRKIKYSKYKERRLIYTLASIFSTLISILGLYLMSYVRLWTMVFAIIGFLSFVTFIVLIILNDKSYLRNEGIIIKDDLNEELYPFYLSIRMNTLRSIMLSVIPYFIYGLVFIIIYMINPEAYISYSSIDVQGFESSIEANYTSVVMTIAWICVGFSFAVLITCKILKLIWNKKYGNIVNKTKIKKNIKLLIILAPIVPASALTVFLCIWLYSAIAGPIVTSYSARYVYDTYEELCERMSTYIVQTVGYEQYGLECGDEFILTLPENLTDEDVPVSGIYDCGNNFMYIRYVSYECNKIFLYEKDEYNDYHKLYSVTGEVWETYINSKTKEDICIYTDDSVQLTIPNEMFIKEYDERLGVYYLNYKIGTYDVSNKYRIIAEEGGTHNTFYGLYYKYNDSLLLDDWLELDFFERIDYRSVAKKVDGKIEYELKPYLSNSIDLNYYSYDSYYNGIKAISTNILGYIHFGEYKGKYGFINYSYVCTSDLAGTYIRPLVILELIVEIALIAILWKRQKYDFEFEITNKDKEKDNC